MKKIKLGGSNLKVPVIGLGCMRMSEITVDQAAIVIRTAVDAGINFFDHADIYGRGESEKLFARAIRQTNIKRDEIVLQSKVGIRQGYYDFSYDHIIQSVDEILNRLDTSYLDSLLLHRPDTLMETEELAQAFKDLRKSGKVNHFGVSNHSPKQMELIRRETGEQLITNQLQLSIPHAGLISSGINVNCRQKSIFPYTNELLEDSRLSSYTIQAWSPVMGESGVFLIDSNYAHLNNTLDSFAKKYKSTKDAMAIAWLLRHPANIQVIIGTMNPKRIKDYAQAASITLNRPDWYEIYRAAGHQLP